jgi:hypothetical protein
VYHDERFGSKVQTVATAEPLAGTTSTQGSPARRRSMLAAIAC